MKPGIHPNYQEARVTCSCGNTFTTRSTKPELRVDLCNVCHPFYTGEQRIVDTAGQVERFTKRFEAAQAAGSSKSKRQRRLEESQRARAQQAAEQAAQKEAADREVRAKIRADRMKAAEEAARKAERAAAELEASNNDIAAAETNATEEAADESTAVEATANEA